MDIKTGGPAFPVQWDDKDNEGMTLRDWFAGQALSGLLSNTKSQATVVDFTKIAYRMADGMIAARSAQ